MAAATILTVSEFIRINFRHDGKEEPVAKLRSIIPSLFKMVDEIQKLHGVDMKDPEAIGFSPL
jgi:hypothetical protein